MIFQIQLLKLDYNISTPTQIVMSVIALFRMLPKVSTEEASFGFKIESNTFFYMWNYSIKSFHSAESINLKRSSSLSIDYSCNEFIRFNEKCSLILRRTQHFLFKWMSFVPPRIFCKQFVSSIHEILRSISVSLLQK